jgi:5-oxoprolinase (ATP-hydrolysing)
VTRWKLSADTGGTFTDCLAEAPDGSIRRGKVLSSGRLRTRVQGLAKANEILIEPLGPAATGWLSGRPVLVGGRGIGHITEARMDRLLLDQPCHGLAAGDVVEVDSGLEAPLLGMRLLLPELDSGEAGVESFRVGTTKGTNALLERKGAPVALFLSEGFADLLLIRDQKRPDLFARRIIKEPPLYHSVHAISGRIDTHGNIGEQLDLEQLAASAEASLKDGCTVAAICLINSWINPVHEQQAKEVLLDAGYKVVSVSSAIRPLIKYLDRTDTTLVNATLSPVMDAYLDAVGHGIGGRPLWIMTSAGGLVSRERFHAVDSLVSGPAGGMLGAVAAGRQAGLDRIIALDMGGTSTDVSRWKDHLELRQQIQVGEARILTPAMPIETVAAGGGARRARGQTPGRPPTLPAGRLP